jgi:hypothetical protein
MTNVNVTSLAREKSAGGKVIYGRKGFRAGIRHRSWNLLCRASDIYSFDHEARLQVMIRAGLAVPPFSFIIDTAFHPIDSLVVLHEAV